VIQLLFLGKEAAEYYHSHCPYMPEVRSTSAAKGMVKKFVQQSRSLFDARSVLSVREHDKMARTPLAAFSNIPIKDSEGFKTHTPQRFS